MTIPNVWDSGECAFGFRADAGMTDFNTFLTNIATELVTGRGWTSLGGNLYKSPPDAAGRWMDLLFTRISATSLEIRMRDHLTRTVYTRRIHIDAGGTTVNYYTGTYYCVIDALRATSEVLQAYIAEPSPDQAADISTISIYGSGFTTTADANDGNGDGVGDLFGYEDTAYAVRAGRVGPLSQHSGGVAIAMVMNSGSLMNEVVQVSNLVTGTLKWCGNLYQAMLVDSSIALQSDKTPKVDGTNAGTFRVIGLATINNQRMAMRK